MAEYIDREMDRSIDCNDCRHLNISEREQNKLKAAGKIKPHICLKFGKKVFHNAKTINHDPYLYPCAECVAQMSRKDDKL